MDNLKVKTKIFLFSTVMILLIIFIGGVGYYYNLKANNDVTSMYKETFLPAEWLNDSRAQARAIEADTYCIILSTKDNEEQKEKLNDIQERKKIYDNNWKMYRENDEPDQFEANIIPIIENDLKGYREVRDASIKLAMEGKQEEALEKYKTVAKTADEFQNNLKSLAVYNTNQAEEISNQSIEDFNYSVKIFMILGLLSVAVATVLAIVISRTIVNPLNKTVGYIKVLAERDFTESISERYLKRKDEVGDLVNSIFIMKNDMSTLIKEIMEKSQDINGSSQELSATAEELTATAENINAAIRGIANDVQETSASAEEISASIQEVDYSINILSSRAMEGSNNANQSKNRAIEVQRKGKSSVEETRRMYDEKKEKGLKAIEDGKVVDHIKVMADTIADISEQTCLLLMLQLKRQGQGNKEKALQ